MQALEAGLRPQSAGMLPLYSTRYEQPVRLQTKSVQEATFRSTHPNVSLRSLRVPLLMACSTPMFESVIGQPVRSPSTLDFQMKIYPNPGFQGPSSLQTVLDDLGAHLAVGNNARASSSNDQLSSRDGVMREDARKLIDEGVRLLDSFLQYLADDAFRRLFLKSHGSGLESHLGNFLIYPFFNSLINEINVIENSQDRQASLKILSQRLFEQAQRPVEITTTMTLNDFTSLYTGPNLRWESIGLILTLAGIVAHEIRAPHPVCKTEEEKQALRTTLVHLSNKCLAFCDTLDTLNDVTMIFLYECFLLASAFYGDQSFRVWRRLNHVSSALFAQGLHQISKGESQLPFFLRQLRKRIFSQIYTSDISFAVFLGRPSRLSKRFCYPAMPLDMEDANMQNITTVALNEQLRHLDSSGWNTLGEIRKSSVMRWSVISAMILEDVLEVLLSRNLTQVSDKVSDLRSKVAQAWADLPNFLTIPEQEVWRRGRSGQEADTLHQIRLSHFHTTFLVEWAASRHGMHQAGALFASASKLLTWVNAALVRREQLGEKGAISLCWTVASCGLPAAGALAWCLLQPPAQTNMNAQLEPAARRHGIESLSVLLAHISILQEPGDGNYQLFCQAATALQSAMDAILSPPSQNSTDSPQDFLTDAAMGQPDWLLPEHFGFGMDSWVGLPDQGSVFGLDDSLLY
ncbi:hypothetical protein A1O1_01647 [Capronia coronata CBS 617.96]|uniref:Transcription factor domain-containing protein n=1 Tax=Capronia coronata CBS 617.96 TaxID=1182541 RepID=W9Z4J4_9EURO|nr:uncharacterized protein A1O1_01647 [Capronia coronata CBS 617.96]EXJ96521.1 hypothetical protein A1O1_01647 [Capronia coronata CBS 617.96]